MASRGKVLGCGKPPCKPTTPGFPALPVTSFLRVGCVLSLASWVRCLSQFTDVLAAGDSSLAFLGLGPLKGLGGAKVAGTSESKGSADTILAGADLGCFKALAKVRFEGLDTLSRYLGSRHRIYPCLPIMRSQGSLREGDLVSIVQFAQFCTANSK